MLNLDINNPDNLAHPPQQQLVGWANHALQALKIDTAIISIQIVNDIDMQHYNHSYRGKNNATNILSFPFERPPGLPEDADVDGFLGDIIICPTVLTKEAREQRKLLNHHWCHILIHGILHLVGYDHIDEADAAEMESLEISLLTELGIDNPYLEK